MARSTLIALCIVGIASLLAGPVAGADNDCRCGGGSLLPPPYVVTDRAALIQHLRADIRDDPSYECLDVVDATASHRLKIDAINAVIRDPGLAPAERKPALACRSEFLESLNFDVGRGNAPLSELIVSSAASAVVDSTRESDEAMRGREIELAVLRAISGPALDRWVNDGDSDAAIAQILLEALKRASVDRQLPSEARSPLRDLAADLDADIRDGALIFTKFALKNDRALARDAAAASHVYPPEDRAEFVALVLSAQGLGRTGQRVIPVLQTEKSGDPAVPAAAKIVARGGRTCRTADDVQRLNRLLHGKAVTAIDRKWGELLERDGIGGKIAWCRDQALAVDSFERSGTGMMQMCDVCPRVPGAG